ncbi:MAG: hypothetical protein ACO3FA_00775 [Vulcanococcus sp.]
MGQQLVTKSEYARIRGVTPAAVTIATRSRIADALITRNGRQLLDLDRANELWERNTAKQPPPAPRPAAAPPPPSAPVTDEQLRAFIQGLPEDAIPDLNESRARREHYAAEKARLEALQGRGELIPAADVKKEAFALARAVRDALMTIPDRLAPELAACTDARQVHQLLGDEIRVALRGLSNG